MSNESVFRGPDEELARLNAELAEIRLSVRDISSQLAQIERHVKRAFGVVKTPKGASSSRSIAKMPPISSDDALTLFRNLTNISRNQGNDEVETCLNNLSLPSLKILAHELGISFPSKANRKTLHTGVRGRISESLLLSNNRNATLALSQNTVEMPEKDNSGSRELKTDEVIDKT